MGNGVEWAYMLPIEAVFQSISKTLGSIHPDLPPPEVQIARGEVVDGANEDYKVLPQPEDRPELSTSESPKLKLSESRSDKHNNENSPAASTPPKPQLPISSFKPSNFDLPDDSRRSVTTDETDAWARKAILSLGKNFRS